MVRRVLPPNDPLGVAASPLPVCLDCAVLIDGSPDGSPLAPSSGLIQNSASGNAKSGAGYALLAVLGILFVAALFAFIHSNG